MKDITNIRFGRLIAVEPTERRKQGSIVWKCKCDCGNVVYASLNNLKQGYVRSCGCLHSESATKRSTARFKNLIGKRFGKLVVLEKTSKRCGGCVVWKCKCDCGNITFVQTNNLTQGNSTSCGCLNSKLAKKNAPKNLKNYLDDNFKDHTRIDFLTRTNRNKNNTTGYTGVYLRKKDRKYVAYLEFKGKRKFVGSFNTKEEAAKARQELKKKVVGSFLEKNK